MLDPLRVLHCMLPRKIQHIVAAQGRVDQLVAAADPHNGLLPLKKLLKGSKFHLIPDHIASGLEVVGHIGISISQVIEGIAKPGGMDAFSSGKRHER